MHSPGSDARDGISGREPEEGTGRVKLLTAQELASYLGIHRETLYAMTRHGLIPGHKVGSNWRFDPEEVMGELRSA